MNTSGRRKALHIGLLCAIGASFTVLLFQNCQKPSAYVEGETSSSSTQQGSNTTTTTIPNVTVGANSYAPIRVDQVCNDSSGEKKALINTYIRLVRRCADRAGLDHWYNLQIRQGANMVSQLEAGLKSSSEYLNLGKAGQTPSDRFCLPGDTFQILYNGQPLTTAQTDALQSTDMRNFTVTCRTTVSQNLTASQSQIVRATVGAGANSAGGYVCSVPGDSLRNHIIELYLAYLDRCPEAQGLEFWAKNWSTDSVFINSPDVVSYIKCRYQNGDPAAATNNSIDACYQSKFNTTLCPGTNVKWVKFRWCEKTGS